MSLCPSNCADLELVPVPAGGCTTEVRERSLFKLGIFACNTSLPSPLTCENLETLVDSNAVVFSNPLSNVDWGAPEFEDLLIADCLPPRRRVISRTLNFQDRVAVDVLPTSGGSADLYADLKYWGDKMEKPLALRYMFLFCDGTLEVARDKKGNPMAASLNVYRNFERQGTGNTSYALEIKQGDIVFKGDPLAIPRDYAPSLLIDDSCDTLKVKLGL